MACIRYSAKMCDYDGLSPGNLMCRREEAKGGAQERKGDGEAG